MDCLTEKLNIVRLPLNVRFKVLIIMNITYFVCFDNLSSNFFLFVISLIQVNLASKSEAIPVCDYYCDTMYLLPYSTFTNLPPGYLLSSVAFQMLMGLPEFIFSYH